MAILLRHDPAEAWSLGDLLGEIPLHFTTRDGADGTTQHRFALVLWRGLAHKALEALQVELEPYEAELAPSLAG